MMKKGQFDVNSPEFIQFKRQNITIWGGLSQLIQDLEKYISQYLINYAYVDINQMIKLVNLEIVKFSKEELLSCITNKTQVNDAITNPKLKYKGPHGPIIAVTALQTAWRRYKAYSSFDQLKFLMDKATVIQRKFRLF